MSVAAKLVAIAAGGRPDGLLGACRCEWQGQEIYGEEAIVEMFRAAPMALGEAVVVETAMAIGLFAEQAALIADLYDGRIGRLWRLSAGDPQLAEPAVAVAFDPDLSQARHDVHFLASDHPELPPSMRPGLIEAARNFVRDAAGDGDVPAHRVRAFVIRAFGSADRGAALLAVHRLGGGPVRSAGFDHAAMMIDSRNEPRIIQAPHLPQEWRPRL